VHSYYEKRVPSNAAINWEKKPLINDIRGEKKKFVCSMATLTERDNELAIDASCAAAPPDHSNK
jgi:hypothetical protein